MSREIIVGAVKELERIVGITLFEEYGVLNIEGDKIQQYEYHLVPQNSALKDLESIASFLAKSYQEADFDSFSAIFVEACNCCFKYDMMEKIDTHKIIALLVGGIEGDEQKFLTHLATGIFKQGCNGTNPMDSFIDAYEIFPENNVVNLYLFIDLANVFYHQDKDEIHNDKDEILKKTMLKTFGALSGDFKEHALGKKLLLPGDSVSDDDYLSDCLLPYVKFIGYDEQVMRAIESDLSHIVRYANIGENEISEAVTSPLGFMIGRLGKRENISGTDPQNLVLWLNSLASRLCNIYVDTLDDDRNDGNPEITPSESDNMESRGEISDDGGRSILERMDLLNIPLTIEPSTAYSFEELIGMQIEAETLVAERDQAIADKDSIISDFTHTYGNMKATSLYNIAQALLKSDNADTKRMGRQVLLEYGIKQDLTKAVYMMRLKFDKNTTEIRRLIRESLSAAAEESVGMADIVDSAMLLSFLRVFYDSSDKKATLARNQLKKVVASLNGLRDSFEEDVIFAAQSVVVWVGEHIMPIKLELSESWRTLLWFRESYGVMFFVDLFAECFYNILKYGDLSAPIEVCLGESNHYLSIAIINSIDKSEETYSGVGLSSKRDMLAIVDRGCFRDSRNQVMSWGIDNNNFHVKMYLSSDIVKGE